MVYWYFISIGRYENLIYRALSVSADMKYQLLPDSGLLHMSGKIPIHANQIQMRLRLNGHFLMPYGLVLPHFYVRGLIFSQSKQSLQDDDKKHIFFRNNGCFSLVKKSVNSTFLPSLKLNRKYDFLSFEIFYQTT